MRALPKSALIMGYAGLIPFILLTVLIIFDIQFADIGKDKLIFLLQTYAAVIISFIGAVHWGVALVKEEEVETSLNTNSFYLYSVMPALLAWLSLFVQQWTFFIQATIVIALYVIDRSKLFSLLSVNYARLRLHLTSVVCICLLIAGWATLK